MSDEILPPNEPITDFIVVETDGIVSTESTDWNARYNRASLYWLELCLRRLVEEKRREAAAKTDRSLPVSAPPGNVVAMEAKGKRRGFGWPPMLFPGQETMTSVPDEMNAPVPLTLPPIPTVPTVSDEQIREAAEERADILRDAPEPPAALRIAAALGLSDFERDTLLLCAAPELRTDFRTLCADGNIVLGLPNTPHPTFALALAALGADSSWDIVSPDRPLRYWNLVEIMRGAGEPLIAAPLHADERIVNALRGLDYPDARLSLFLRSPEPWQPPFAPESSQAEARDEILWGWDRSLANGDTNGLPVVQLLGADTPAKSRLALQAAITLGRIVYRLSLEELNQIGLELESATRLLLRECHLSPIALYLDAHHGLEGGAENSRDALLRRFVTLTAGRMPLFLGVREAWERDRRSDIVVEARLPTPAEQRTAWLDALGADAGDLPSRLSAQFRLDTPEITAIVADSRFEAEQRNRPLADTLWNACRDRVRPRLDAHAHRIETKARLDDLVLPPDTFALIQQVAAQVAQRSRVYTDWGFAERSDRGLGISVLFAGESGTGKTMAAEALANRLQLSLYRIDLSSVVSKYIGETEENLRQVFDAAEEGGVVLLFDEADSLFGKRTDVKDSHDRYANIEVNYLLQRMEAYQGLAILATNRKSALDSAFLRRLRFLITFPMPGVAERKRLWEKAFPPGTPVEGLDTDRLARLVLSGGNIASVAINAAFLAADSGSAVTMPLILRAARNEFVKLERSINEADFR